MYLLVETIRIKNGVPENLRWHQDRYERSCRTFYKTSPKIFIEEELNIPAEFSEGIVKCRFLYNKDSVKTEFQHYSARPINSLKLVEDNGIEYSLKFTDRTAINNLLKSKKECEDILIIKEGFITDTSIANIVFFDGKKWITPADPLLKGTARERLLNENIISTAEITENDIKQFSHFKLINAMLEFDVQEMKDISCIK